MFNRQEFLQLQQAMGRKFTLDGACNNSGDNSLVPDNYCCPASSYFDKSLTGEFMFLNGPFSQLAEMLAYYLQEKAKDPYNTSACFVVPAWRGALFNDYLKGMTIVKTVPKGHSILVLGKRCSNR